MYATHTKDRDGVTTATGKFIYTSKRRAIQFAHSLIKYHDHPRADVFEQVFSKQDGCIIRVNSIRDGCIAQFVGHAARDGSIKVKRVPFQLDLMLRRPAAAPAQL